MRHPKPYLDKSGRRYESWRMRERMSQRLAAVIGLLIVQAGAAQAGYRISYEAVSYSTEDETERVVNRQNNVMLIDEGKLRTAGGDAGGFDLIADLRDARIFVLDAMRMMYAEIEFPPAIADTAADTAGGVLQIQVEDTGPVILKHATHHYGIYEDSTLIREIWTTEELNLGFDFMHAMDGLERAFQKFAPAEDYNEFSSIFRRVRGVPLKDVQYYPFGRDVLQATRIERVKFGPHEFLPPKDYGKRMLKDLAEGDIDDEDSGDLPPAGP